MWEATFPQPHIWWFPHLGCIHQRCERSRTLSANLAAAAFLAGKRTIMLDLDRQGTAFDWFNSRQEGSSLEGLRVVHADRALSIPRIRELADRAELVFLDGAPRLNEVTRAAAVAADLVLLPIQATSPDIWAAAETLELLDEADGMRATMGLKPVRRLFVINRATPNSVAAREAPGLLAKRGKVCGVVIHNRLAFQEAMTTGESVLTTEPDSTSADEIRQLYRMVCS
jgi:chromosome partitioning protein